MRTQYAFLFSAIFSTGLFLLPSVSVAQLAMMKRTPELKRLEIFIGQWIRSADEVQTGGPSPKSAKMAIAWGPGDLWMTWNAEIQFSTGQTLHGRRQITWNSEKNVYTSSWIDTQSAHIITSTARWTGDSTFKIETDPFTWSDGHTYRFRTQYKFVSAREISETGWRSVDGGTFKKHSEASWTKKE